VVRWSEGEASPLLVGSGQWLAWKYGGVRTKTTRYPMRTLGINIGSTSLKHAHHFIIFSVSLLL